MQLWEGDTIQYDNIFGVGTGQYYLGTRQTSKTLVQMFKLSPLFKKSQSKLDGQQSKSCSAAVIRRMKDAS